MKALNFDFDFERWTLNFEPNLNFALSSIYKVKHLQIAHQSCWALKFCKGSPAKIAQPNRPQEIRGASRVHRSLSVAAGSTL